MPKIGKYYDESLTIGIRSEVKAKLAAVARWRGDTDISAVARSMLLRSLEEFELDLAPAEVKRFNLLVDSANAELWVRKQQMEERARARQREKKAREHYEPLKRLAKL